MSHQFLGKRILVLTAHPDDETYLAAGTTMLNKRAGGSSALICATAGEKGSSHLLRPITPAQLKAMRRRELLKAARVARISPIHLFTFPDGGVFRHRQEFYRRALRLARRWKPELLLTFGRDGITGHRDHVACWQVGRKVARELDISLFVFTVPDVLRTKAHRWFIRRRVNPHYRDISPYPKADVEVRFPRSFKRAVFACHPSQLDVDNPYSTFPAIAARIVTGGEWFARAN